MSLQFYGCRDIRYSCLYLHIQPEDTVIDLYVRWQRKYYEHINLLSRTDAMGWAWLINGFQDKKMDFNDMLPVQLKAQNFQLPDKYSKPTDETLQILKRNIEAGRVPRKVLLALTTDNIFQQLLKY